MWLRFRLQRRGLLFHCFVWFMVLFWQPIIRCPRIHCNPYHRGCCFHSGLVYFRVSTTLWRPKHYSAPDSGSTAYNSYSTSYCPVACYSTTIYLNQCLSTNLSINVSPNIRPHINLSTKNMVLHRLLFHQFLYPILRNMWDNLLIISSLLWTTLSTIMQQIKDLPSLTVNFSYPSSLSRNWNVFFLIVSVSQDLVEQSNWSEYLWRKYQ